MSDTQAPEARGVGSLRFSGFVGCIQALRSSVLREFGIQGDKDFECKES